MSSMSRFTSRLDKVDYVYNLYKYESATSGEFGNIIIVKVHNKSRKVDVKTDTYLEYSSGANPWEKERLIKSSKKLMEFFDPSSGIFPSPLNATPFANLDAAKFEALRAQLGRSYRAHVDQSMPLAWIAFTQLIFVAALFTPGVMFFGSVYALVAQAAVVISTLMNNSPFIMTASRFSTAVVIGNLLLCLLLWNSAYSTVEKVSAAYRSAVVLVSGFAIVCSNEYLNSIVKPYERVY